MNGFTFDATASLQRAQKCRDLPTPPTPPTNRQSEGEKVGTVGDVGTERAFHPEITPDELALDLYEERAAIREYEGGQSRPDAERAAWAEAQHAAGVTGPTPDTNDTTRQPR